MNKTETSFTFVCPSIDRFGDFLRYLHWGLLICFIALIAIIVFWIKAQRNQRPVKHFYYMIDRIAVISFLYGCFLAALVIWHSFEGLMTARGIEVFMIAMVVISQECLNFAYACGVSLFAVIISVILKLIEKRASNKENYRD